MLHYLYFHIEQDTHNVFYIGQGTQNNSRRHGKRYDKSMWWKNKVNKHGYYYIIAKRNLTKEQADVLEKFFIKAFGRADLNEGNLVNLTNGGEGVEGYKHTQERLEKIRNSLAGRSPWNKGKSMPKSMYTDEYRKKLSNSQLGRNTWTKGVPKTEEHKRKIADANRGKPKPKIQCKVCGVYMDAGNLAKYHKHN